MEALIKPDGMIEYLFLGTTRNGFQQTPVNPALLGDPKPRRLRQVIIMVLNKGKFRRFPSYCTGTTNEFFLNKNVSLMLNVG